MKKIIVITRENNDAFRHHDIISKHIAQNNSIYSPDKLFAHLFNCALNISTEEPEGDPVTKFNTLLFKNQQSNRTFFTEAEPTDLLLYPEEYKMKLFDIYKNKYQQPYITFHLTENIEITFILWDKLPLSEYTITIYKKKRLELILAICEDCKIVDNKEKNMLYIHDTQWGVSEDMELIREGEKVEDADISEEETNKLKTLFTYIASFRHTTTEYNATIFDKILAFDFNGIPLIKLCKEVEAILKNGTFISALEFLNSKDKLSQLDNHDNY